MTDSPPMTDDVFARYQQAWSEGNIEAIVSMMTPDGVYEASMGPEEWGARYVGHDEIRAALHAMGIGTSRTGGHVYGERVLVGDRGFSEWTSQTTGPDGEPFTIYGADVYEFRDGLVSKKIAYRKHVVR